MKTDLLTVKNVTKYFPLKGGRGTVHAVEDSYLALASAKQNFEANGVKAESLQIADGLEPFLLTWSALILLLSLGIGSSSCRSIDFLIAAQIDRSGTPLVDLLRRCLPELP